MSTVPRVLVAFDEGGLLMGLVILLVLLLIVLGGLPTWGYHNYGYAPSGVGGILLIIVLLLLLTGRL